MPGIATLFNFDTSALTKLGAEHLHAQFYGSDWSTGTFYHLLESSTVKLGIGTSSIEGSKIDGYGLKNGVIESFENTGSGACDLQNIHAGTYNVKLGAKLIDKSGIDATYRITCTVNPAA